MFKQGSGESQVVLQKTSVVTHIPHADDVDQAVEKARGKYKQWSKESIEAVNDLIRNAGIDWQTAVAIIEREAVKEDKEYNVSDHVQTIEQTLSTSTHPSRLEGEGMDGVMHVQKTKVQSARVAAKDAGLGFTSSGVPIKPRLKPYCNNGHKVIGDNIYITPGTGQQCCKLCNSGYKADLINNRRVMRGKQGFGVI